MTTSAAMRRRQRRHGLRADPSVGRAAATREEEVRAAASGESEQTGESSRLAAEQDVGGEDDAADRVVEASRESFPASDAPSWIPVRV